MGKVTNKEPTKPFILPCDDPLGLKNINLPGAPPSITTEAEIARKEWFSKNGNASTSQTNARSKTQKS